MGQSISSLLKPTARERHHLLMVGLDAAGRTTILESLNLGEVVTTIPAIGFNIKTVDSKNLKITSWQVGGSRIRRMWRPYFKGVHGIVFVIDSNDHNRVREARDELQWMLAEEGLRNAVLLVLANKQDLPTAMKPSDLMVELDLTLSEHRQRVWFIQGCCATTAQGLDEGLDWMSVNITKALQNGANAAA